MNSKVFDEKLGGILRQRRNTKGYSLAQVAEFLNVTKQAVYNWETGKRSMYAETLREYCRILGTSMQEVFDEMEDVE